MPHMVAVLCTISDVVCHRKQLEGLGRRLLDRFKQHYEQKKKKRKEKRNSTKKELHEDGKILLQRWLFSVKRVITIS